MAWLAHCSRMDGYYVHELIGVWGVKWTVDGRGLYVWRWGSSYPKGPSWVGDDVGGWAELMHRSIYI